MAEGRDSKGHFLPGAHIFGKGRGIKNGRKKTIGGEVKTAYQEAEEKMPEIIRLMIKRAMDYKDPLQLKAATDLADRIYGKANQPMFTKGKIIVEVVYAPVSSSGRNEVDEQAIEDNAD